MVRSPRQTAAPGFPGVAVMEGSDQISSGKGASPKALILIILTYCSILWGKKVGHMLVGTNQKLKRISESSWNQHTTSVLEPADLIYLRGYLWE